MRVWLTGASGVLGPALCDALAGAGYEVFAVSRASRSGTASCQWRIGNIEKPESLSELPAPDILVHAAPLWLAPAMLPHAAARGARRAVLFGSTSVLTKRASALSHDREIAGLLQRAEEQCARTCAEGGIALTLLRPTLIYGYGRDRNVSTIAHFIRRFRFFPVAGEARGCRQPVHVDDLALAAASALAAPVTAGRVYNLGGGERLSYREMVGRIFEALRLPRRIVSVPVPLYRRLLALRSRMTGNRETSAGAADRMNEDLCFDTTDAARDLGFRPQVFLANPARDLP
jgi:nucleoside-diphosphate-sugar epimerase